MDSESIVKDLSQAKEGELELKFARDNMHALKLIGERFAKEQPFEGITIGIALHLEKKTGILLETLAKGGAKVYGTSCNPLTTDDRVAAALAADETNNIWIRAKSGQTNEEYYDNLQWVINNKPNIVIDDGGDLAFLLHTKMRDYIPDIIGGCEETTTGIIRLRSLEQEGKLEFPMMAINDAYSKHLFDNRFGTGQSTCTAILQITNLTFKGKTVVVVGFGDCGKGVAETFKGIGANVIVVEVGERILDFGPSGWHKALEALYSGYRVMTMDEATKYGDVFITVTGDKHVITLDHMKQMKDGVILANSGHFNIEIDAEGLKEESEKITRINSNMEEYMMDGKRYYLLSEARLVNLARPIGLGHPVEIMDGSFAVQALSCEYLAKNKGQLKKKLYNVPNEVDDMVAETILASFDIELDPLTEEQRKYLASWDEGT